MCTIGSGIDPVDSSPVASIHLVAYFITLPLQQLPVLTKTSLAPGLVLSQRPNNPKFSFFNPAYGIVLVSAYLTDTCPCPGKRTAKKTQEKAAESEAREIMEFNLYKWMGPKVDTESPTPHPHHLDLRNGGEYEDLLVTGLLPLQMK
jgi:hypothetical protein